MYAQVSGHLETRLWKMMRSRFRSTKFRETRSADVQQLAFKKGDTLCNICEQKRNLTDDHIPPRCCGNDKAIVARRIYAEELIARQVDAKSNNGLKWRTLCRQCNGDLIGRWDPALGEFTKQTEAIISPSLALPQRLNMNIRGGAVLRSLLGHVVAAKTQGDAVPLDAKIRDYLLDRAALDPKIGVYCWLYPYRPIVVARDFTWVEVEGEGGASPGLATVIKFYPLAVLVLDASVKGQSNSNYMTPLHPFAGTDENLETAIEILRQPIFHPGWPERAMGNHLVLGGRTYVDSVTTDTPGGAAITPGKQVQAEAWPGGDAGDMLNGLHAFVEVPEA